MLNSTETSINNTINNVNKIDVEKSAMQTQAKNFISWYKHMVDHERLNLALYLSDDAILEWFGRTVKTKKKVSNFLRHEMQYSKHDFVSVKSINMIQGRHEKHPRKEDSSSDSDIIPKSENTLKRKLFETKCGSPEWAEGCEPQDEQPTENKISKICLLDKIEPVTDPSFIVQRNGVKRSLDNEDDIHSNSKGDGAERRVKRRLAPITPPNEEIGQGDCLPSTSGTDADKSHDALNAQLPKLFVECNGYIQFTRTKNSGINDTMKWERKCKAQISYSKDPLNVGEYIIWAIHYTDESKCRRNLLSAFEEVDDTK